MALSTMKDEGPYVVEWVAHHLAVGFTDIMVYTNDCSDGTDTILKHLESLDIGVYHRENIIPEGVKPHPSMLHLAGQEELVQGSTWLLVLDADEFMCINHPSHHLDGLVDDLEKIGAAAMVCTWRIFGSSGVRDWSRAPVTDQFTRAAPVFWNKGWGTKTMLKFDPKYLRLGMHRPIIKSQWKDTDWPDTQLWVNGSGRPLEDWFKLRGWRSIRRTVGYDWAQINHYAIKSMDAYSLRKFRGNANLKKDKYNSDYWSLQDRNEVEDKNIFRFAARREIIRQQLLADPLVRELHEAAHQHAEARLKEYRQSPAYQELVEGLVAASNVPITQVVAKPPKARDPAEVAAVQSKIDARRAAKPKDERRTPPPPGLGSAFGSPYVLGPIDLSHKIALEEVENQQIRIPLDPRIFTAAALESVQAGKFDRRHARNIVGFLAGCSRLLELGAGFGYIPLRAKAAREDLHIAVQDDREGLIQFGAFIAAKHFPNAGHMISLAAAPLRRNEEESYAGLDRLLADFNPDVLRLPGTLLPPEALTEARVSGIRRILFPFLDPSEIEQGRATHAAHLKQFGFSEDSSGASAGSLYLRRD